MPEFAYDVDIRVAIRVEAETEEQASEIVSNLIDADLNDLKENDCELTEFSVHEIDNPPFEIDGISQKTPERGNQ